MIEGKKNYYFISITKFLFIIMALAALPDTFAIVSFMAKNGIAATRVDGTLSFKIQFPRSLSVPISLSSTKPVCRNIPTVGSCKWTFRVNLPVKEQKTAIGWIFQDPPTTKYLTPDHVNIEPLSTSSSNEATYISMGGAGFIYPSKSRASRGYAVTDTVETTLDFSSCEISFSVNGQVVYTTTLSAEIDFAYPTISSNGGEVVAIASVENVL